jgi:hypothetical protein
MFQTGFSKTRRQPLSKSLDRCGSVWVLGMVVALASGETRAADQTCTGGVSGNLWDLTVANWSVSPWVNENQAIFGSAGIAFPTVSISGGVSASGLMFNATGYEVGGP